MKKLKKLLSSLILSVMCFSVLAYLLPHPTLALETIQSESEKEKEIELIGAEGKEEFIDILVEPSSELEIPTSLSEKSTINSIVDRVKYYSTEISGTLPSSYKTMGLTVKNQQDTGECWAFVTTSMIEAYNLKHNLASEQYSPRHIDYTCSKSFTNLSSVTESLLNRETSANVGNYLLTIAYLSGARGPVLESSLPFENDTEKKIDYNSLKQSVKELTKELTILPGIFKKYNTDGTITYHKNSNLSLSSKYTDTDLKAARQTLKEQIYNNGGIASMVYQLGLTTNIYEGEGSSVFSPNHAIFIVGWDDSYTASGWKNPGAYICLNSYGTSNFDNGYCYVSYDDKFIEQGMLALKSAETYNIDHVYEHDPWGSNTAVASNSLTNSQVTQYDNSEITAINVFNKKTNYAEKLTQVGFTSWSVQKAEIYFTDEFGSEGFPKNFRKVKSATKTLDSGYYVFDLDTPVTITDGKYAVAVRFIEDNVENVASAAIENYSTDASTWWTDIPGNEDESYFIDKIATTDNQQVYWSIPRSIGGYCNASIKAYTVDTTTPDPPVSEDPEDLILSDIYEIDGKNRRIVRVEPGTTLNDFSQHIFQNPAYIETIENYQAYLYDADGTWLTPSDNGNDLIKTGFKLHVSKTDYYIAVRGDLSGDGKRDIIDLAKMRSHLVGMTGKVLTGIYYYGADINCNGTVDIVDLAQLRRLLVE